MAEHLLAAKGMPCLLSISRLPRSHQVGHTQKEEEEELTGKDSKLKMRNNMADEATAIHTATMCMT
ncbi:TPA: hypothetical protein ACH3X3_012556 [Trebouxia sp. C0006]